MAERTALTEDAWAGLETRLRAYVRRRVDPLWVDDLVGDILFRLVQHREQLESAGNPVAWMRRVAANAVTDHHRRRSTERRALRLAAGEAGDDSPADDAAAGDAAAELGHCVVPFIHLLPERYRDALVLTDIEGSTQAAAARRLGLSHSGLKSRVQRARAKLKEALLACCDIQVDRRRGVFGYDRRGGGCEHRC